MHPGQPHNTDLAARNVSRLRNRSFGLVRWLWEYELVGKVWATVLSAEETLPRVSNLLASLGHTGRRIVLGHTFNTQTLMKTDEQKKKKDFK